MCKISVLMPVYNAEEHLAAAVESILQQTFANFEFITVNDGSNDGSLAILQQFAARDARIRIISRPNTGIVGALNDGLAAATGEFIARMDADDLCDPRRFELQLAAFQNQPDLLLVGSCAKVIDPQGRSLGIIEVPLTFDEIDASHMRGSSRIFHPAALIRTEAIRRVGGYRSKAWPSEDLDLWLRLAETGRLVNLPEPLFVWRWSLGSVVSRNRPAIRIALKWVMEDAWRRRNCVGNYEVPVVTVESLGSTYRRWGWLAARHGHAAVGRHYGFKSIMADPFCRESWSLMLHSIKRQFVAS